MNIIVRSIALLLVITLLHFANAVTAQNERTYDFRLKRKNFRLNHSYKFTFKIFIFMDK